MALRPCHIGFPFSDERTQGFCSRRLLALDVALQHWPTGEAIVPRNVLLRISQLRGRVLSPQVLQQLLRLLSKVFETWTGWELTRHLSSWLPNVRLMGKKESAA